jgi:hypothetical protein
MHDPRLFRQDSTLTLTPDISIDEAARLVAGTREKLAIISFYPGSTHNLIIKTAENLFGQPHFISEALGLSAVGTDEILDQLGVRVEQCDTIFSLNRAV